MGRLFARIWPFDRVKDQALGRGDRFSANFQRMIDRPEEALAALAADPAGFEEQVRLDESSQIRASAALPTDGFLGFLLFDATGNAALLQSGILSHLQGSDLGINDIFDPDQALYFHGIRKEMRSVVILSAMYPDTNAATREAVKPLSDLVGDYGDVMEAFNSYVFALQNGMDTSKIIGWMSERNVATMIR